LVVLEGVEALVVVEALVGTVAGTGLTVVAGAPSVELADAGGVVTAVAGAWVVFAAVDWAFVRPPATRSAAAVAAKRTLTRPAFMSDHFLRFVRRGSTRKVCVPGEP
jgi:hypothetical protein